jgi:hypothetical protein
MLDDVLKSGPLDDGIFDEESDDDSKSVDVPTPPARAAPPAEVAASAVRRDLISAVKLRMKKGFYNTDTVLDDLSHDFARALSQRY